MKTKLDTKETKILDKAEAEIITNMLKILIKAYKGRVITHSPKHRCYLYNQTIFGHEFRFSVDTRDIVDGMEICMFLGSKYAELVKKDEICPFIATAIPDKFKKFTTVTK